MQVHKELGNHWVICHGRQWGRKYPTFYVCRRNTDKSLTAEEQYAPMGETEFLSATNAEQYARGLMKQLVESEE